jgi:hypothetical protein
VAIRAWLVSQCSIERLSATDGLFPRAPDMNRQLRMPGDDVLRKGGELRASGRAVGLGDSEVRTPTADRFESCGL